MDTSFRLADTSYLKRHDPARRTVCFYAVAILPTLFGNWALAREWARIGSPGTVPTDWYGSEEATAALTRLAEQKARRGYRTAGR